MDWFQGFRRADGRIGIRNHIVVLSSVVCANKAVSLLAESMGDVVGITHQHGCSQLGEDRDQTLQVLAGFAAHPNVYGALVIGLGCETISSEEIASQAKREDGSIAALEIQKCGGIYNTVEKGKKIVERFLERAANVKRERVGLEGLILGTECGGSDSLSGISSNPALGVASDRIIQQGGTVVLSETPEIIGAEHILGSRCIDDMVKNQLYSIVKAFEDKAITMGHDIRGANPAPGNIAGGITTIEEKSLGCIRKAGATPVVEVIGYAKKPTKRGLVVMDTPGNDVESITGMLAGGAQIVVFTTGRGTPVGSSIAPVIKVASNSLLYERMKDHMDINAGEITENIKSIQEKGEEIFWSVIETAEGRLTKAEELKTYDFAINRLGPTF